MTNPSIHPQALALTERCLLLNSDRLHPSMLHQTYSGMIPVLSMVESIGRGLGLGTQSD